MIRAALIAGILLAQGGEPEAKPKAPKEERAEKKKAPKAEEEGITPLIAVSQSLVVKVPTKDVAADAVITHAESLGGYFTTRTDQEVILKVPVQKAKSVETFVEKQGKVVQKTFNARDVGAYLEEQRTLLSSRESVLKRFFNVLGTARAEAVVSVEREMTQLVQEIESLRGSIKLVEHQLEYAEIRVSFQFRDRRPPIRDGNSSFQWLNTVNLQDLQQEFAHDWF